VVTTGFPGNHQYGAVSLLYGQVGQVDAAPTEAQRKVSEHLKEELGEVLHTWERLKETAIPKLNRQLSGAHLPVINLEQKPENMPEGGDED